jgi:hypothetical protein
MKSNVAVRVIMTGVLLLAGVAAPATAAGPGTSGCQPPAQGGDFSTGPTLENGTYAIYYAPEGVVAYDRTTLEQLLQNRTLTTAGESGSVAIAINQSIINDYAGSAREFRDLLNSDRALLWLDERRFGTAKRPIGINITGGAIRSVVATNRSMYVFLNVSRGKPFYPDASGTPDEQLRMNAYAVNLTIDGRVLIPSSPDPDIWYTASVEGFTGGKLSTDEWLEYAPAAGQPLGANTTLPPGTNLTATVAFDDGPTLRRHAEVQYAGPDAWPYFRFVFDFSEVQSGSRANVSIRYADGERYFVGPDRLRIGSGDARVEGVTADIGAGELRVERLNMSDGGFIAICDAGTGHPVVISSPVTPGTVNETDVTVSADMVGNYSGDRRYVAVLHRDTDGDIAYDPAFDGAYGRGTAVVTAPAEVVTPTTETPTPEPPSPSPTTGERTEDTGTTGQGSGFGIIAALLALCYIAVRRR